MDKHGLIPNSLLQNDGSRKFVDVTFSSGLGEEYYSIQTAAWADYDNDGDLDLYIGNEFLKKGVHAPCQRFRNNGNETFPDVAKEAGVQNGGYTKGVLWGDYDADGFPDLYVSKWREQSIVSKQPERHIQRCNPGARSRRTDHEFLSLVLRFRQ